MAPTPVMPEVLLEWRTGSREQQRPVLCHSCRFRCGRVVQLYVLFQTTIGAEGINVCGQGLFCFFLFPHQLSKKHLLDIFKKGQLALRVSNGDVESRRGGGRTERGVDGIGFFGHLVDIGHHGQLGHLGHLGQI